MSSIKTIKSIIGLEAVGFLAIVVLLWLDEIVDLPHLVLGATPTPANYSEVVLESLLVLCFGAIVIGVSIALARRIMKLESLFTVCLVCEKVCMPGGDPERQESWQETDIFVIDKTGTHLTNAICPDCRKKYGDRIPE